jgi:TerB-C domain
LDASKIDALTKETHEVISILSKLMTESDPIESDSLKTDTASTAVLEPAEWLSDLDERYHPAFLKLITKGEISLRDFDTFAATYHFIPEDLFNTINTWSDEALGDFLLERGDNICVRRELWSKCPILVAAA